MKNLSNINSYIKKICKINYKNIYSVKLLTKMIHDTILNIVLFATQGISLSRFSSCQNSF